MFSVKCIKQRDGLPTPLQYVHIYSFQTHVTYILAWNTNWKIVQKFAALIDI